MDKNERVEREESLHTPGGPKLLMFGYNVYNKLEILIFVIRVTDLIKTILLRAVYSKASKCWCCSVFVTFAERTGSV